MAIIYTQQGIPVLIDDDDYDRLSIISWNSYDRYVDACINGRTTKIHRYILNISDPNVFIDHKNGITTDNRKENLRICSRYQNQQNRKINSNNKTGAKGIHVLENGKFRARVQSFGKRYHLGVYQTFEEAKRAREEFAQSNHKEFYREK